MSFGDTPQNWTRRQDYLMSIQVSNSLPAFHAAIDAWRVSEFTVDDLRCIGVEGTARARLTLQRIDHIKKFTGCMLVTAVNTKNIQAYASQASALARLAHYL